MWAFKTMCDEFFVTSRLNFKLELNPSRETLLHFCEQIRKAFPRMSRLRRRQSGGVVLDEEDGAEDAARRYVRVEPMSLRFGIFGADDRLSLERLAGVVLTQAPFHLSLSDLDYDQFEVIFGFDLEYRGNHDELVAETLLSDHPLVAGVTPPGARTIDCQPFMGFALDEDCTTQAFMDVKSRTSTFEVRSNEYEPNIITIYATVRRYMTSRFAGDLIKLHHELLLAAEKFAGQRVLPHVVQPLAAAIASRR
ncbi:hypothetical protein RAS1_15500 [Phycisphaerae bacterium RAS1]|nr:hypothetical protein RAS1_15500 [Phycisphaerae bacterium RAS1]